MISRECKTADRRLLDGGSFANGCGHLLRARLWRIRLGSYSGVGSRQQP